jgi:YD repeat-containing protein
LTLAGQEAQRFQWNAAGQLISWQRCDKSVVAFNYRDGLLSEVAEAGGAPQHFAWAKNSGYGRGDSRWDVPVHLASDEHSDYIYSMSSKGFILSRRDRITRIMTTTIYNPRRRQLEQQVGNASIIVTFRRGPTSGNTGLESVVSGSGEILEEFSYDEKGQLIGMKRKGEPDRKLSYDESGRLMALDDLSTP